MQGFYGVGVLLNVAWTYFFHNWLITLIAFYVVPLILTILGMVFLVKDTPMCLVTRYSPAKALKSFRFIAHHNKK